MGDHRELRCALPVVVCKSPHSCTIGFTQSLLDLNPVPVSHNYLCGCECDRALLQIFPIPMRLLVNCGMICPVHACCGRCGMLISAVVVDVISFPLATLTVM